MKRMVICKVLKREAEGLDTPPYPGDLGVRIFESVSKSGWQEWLTRLTTIINENQLNTADPGSLQVIEQHMLGFIFGEGDLGQLPPGFNPAGGKK
jgi:Fe-S cluster biosynthesis and repair protein YggX